MPCVHMDSTIISNVPWFWILQTSLSEDPRQYLLMTRPMPLWMLPVHSISAPRPHYYATHKGNVLIPFL
jgi:hypothetical protein